MEISSWHMKEEPYGMSAPQNYIIKHQNQTDPPRIFPHVMPGIIGLKYVLSFQGNLPLNKNLILWGFHDESEISVVFLHWMVFPPSSHFYALPQAGIRVIPGR